MWEYICLNSFSCKDCLPHTKPTRGLLGLLCLGIQIFQSITTTRQIHLRILWKILCSSSIQLNLYCLPFQNCSGVPRQLKVHFTLDWYLLCFQYLRLLKNYWEEQKCFERNQINVLFSYLWMKSEELRGHRSYYVMLFKGNESLS